MRIRANRCARVGIGGLLLWFGFQPIYAQRAKPNDLSDASLEQLMNVEVTSVSKKEQRISKVAAAIYVISQEEIRRSGATNIPDLLRMVPGMDVAQIRANTWAVSARGFNGVYANKLLVLIDGRTVYNPVFSGVFWFMQDVPLVDIERIEVIRGPGATVWGANAVNGVINIITMSSKLTHGVLLEAAAGTQLEARGLAQFGGAIGKRVDFRAFANYSGFNNLVDAQGRESADAWHIRHAGFRSDLDLTPRDSLTVQGDISDSLGGETTTGFASLTPPYQSVFNDTVTSRNGNILGRWKHVFSPRSETELQVYFDRLDGIVYGVHGIVNTEDFDFQHHLTLGSRNDLVWGLGFRAIQDNYTSSAAVSFSPPKESENLASAFVQDEIKLVDSLWLTLGSKFEHNGRTGNSLQPSVRLMYSPDDRHSLWGAVSRALRQPARSDKEFRFNYIAYPGPNGLTNLISVMGNSAFQAEDLRAYELGYRWIPNNRISVDISTSFNRYYHLKSVEPGTPFLEVTPPPVHLVIPQIFDNKTNGNSYGSEASLNINLTSHWKLSPSYSWFKVNLHPGPGSLDTAPKVINGDTPQSQWQLHSYSSFWRNYDFDTSIYYVGRLADLNVPGYVRLDARLARRIGESAELSIIGQNLLDDQHLEFPQTIESAAASQVRRSVYAKISWRF